MSAFRIFKKDLSKSSIGAILKKARIRKQVSFEEIENATNIRIKYLRAMEDENWNKLPSGPYASGFLVLYAEFLGIPKEKIEELYHREMGIKHALKKKIIPERQEVKSRRVFITPAIIAGISLGLLVLGVIGYIGYQIFGFAASPFLIIATPQNGAVVLEDSIVIEGKTQKGAVILINGQELGVDGEGNFKQEVKLKEGSNGIDVVAKNQVGRKTEKNLVVLYQDASGNKEQISKAN